MAFLDLFLFEYPTSLMRDGCLPPQSYPFIESDIFFLARSTSSTLTVTLCLALTTSGGILHKSIPKLADVHQPVLIHSYVHECPEDCDIGHNAGQLHARL